MVIFLIVVAIIMVVVIGVSTKKDKEKHDEAMQQNLDSLADFNTTSEIKGPVDWFVVKFDELNGKIAYISHEGIKVFSFKELISVELLENGVVKYKKSIAGTVGGAVVGGMLAGQAGMVVGGLSSATKQEKEINTIIVKLLLDSLTNPTVEIKCWYYEIKNQSGELNTSRQIANQLVDTFKVIINRNSSQMNT